MPHEIKSGISVADMVSDNYTYASVNETSASVLDACPKIQLEAHEYYIEDNNTMIVFIPAYNVTLQSYEYRIGNDSRLNICLPEFDVEDMGWAAKGLGYITMVGVSLSIFFLLLHLLVFGMTPKLRNLSSMNLASLSFSLLLMYCAFLAGICLQRTGVSCSVMAVIIHYGLLASFCWMLTIAFDINRVLRQTTKQLLVLRGKNSLYTSCSTSIMPYMQKYFEDAGSMYVDTGEKMGVKLDTTSAIHRLQESLWFGEEGSIVQYP
jgi:hypothetical protein